MTNDTSGIDGPPTSSQVCWWEVYEFAARMQEGIAPEGFPAAGTPAWCDLPDDDPAKLAAVLDSGVHHALRVETAQEAAAEASRSISAAVDWAAVGRRTQDQDEWYMSHPWMRRVI